MAWINKDTLNSCWQWLGDQENRKIISWICSGLAVVVSGLWFAFHPPGNKAPATPTKNSGNTTIISTCGVAGGGDITIGGDYTSCAEPPEAIPLPK